MSLSLRSIDDLKVARSTGWFCFACCLHVIRICLQFNLASVYLESRLPMQRLLWNERWARETAAFVLVFFYFRMGF